MIATLSAAGVERQLAALHGAHRVDVNCVAGSAAADYDEARVTLEASLQRKGSGPQGAGQVKHPNRPRHLPAPDATIIGAPSSTKNADNAREPRCTGPGKVSSGTSA